MITLISKLFGLFAVIAQILGLVLIAVGIFVPEARSYFIIRGVVLTILGGFGFYFHDKLDDWLEEKRDKERKAKKAKLEASVQKELNNEHSRGSLLLQGLIGLLIIFGIGKLMLHLIDFIFDFF